MQTDATIGLLEEATQQLGDQHRTFVLATRQVETVETKREAEKRERDAKRKEAERRAKEAEKQLKQAQKVAIRQAKEEEKQAKRREKEAEKQAKGKAKQTSTKVKPVATSASGTARSQIIQLRPDNATLAESPSEGGPSAVPKTANDGKDSAACPEPKRKPVKMNIGTVKFHMLGHYVPDIKKFGPTDLYSTEWGESFHQAPKAWAKHTSWRQICKEISQHERRRVCLRRVQYRIAASGASPKLQELLEQCAAARKPDIHHFIGLSKQNSVSLADLSPGGRFSSDPASVNFLRNLKQHLLPKYIALVRQNATAQEASTLAQAEDWSNIVFKGDRLYTHKIMRIKYTTYDTRRDEDIIHVETDQCNIMVLNPDYLHRAASSHPFRYGKVLGILHVDVGYVGSIGRNGRQYTFTRMEILWVRWYKVLPVSEDFSLDRVGLLPIDEPGNLAVGKSGLAQDGTDWNEYFINRFVDRDMFMRYEWGLAVGHMYTHQAAVAANLEVIARSHEHNSDGCNGAQGNDNGTGEGGEASLVPANGTTGANSDGDESRNSQDDGRDEEHSGVGEKDDERGEGRGEDEDVDEDVDEKVNYNEPGVEEGVGSDYDGEADEDRDFAKGYESEEEREYFIFGEGGDSRW